MKKQVSWKERVFSNGAYKLVALFVALVLWVTILGRKDTMISRSMELEYLLPRNHVISNEVARKVEVKVAGPRMALKKFSRQPATVTLDLKHVKSGWNLIDVGKQDLNLPLGVRVLSIVPSSIKANVSVEAEAIEEKEDDKS